MPERLLELPDARLWLFDLLAEPAADELAWLDAEELARAHRLAFAVDRRRYLAAHAGLRRRLGAELRRPSGALAFERDALGKPRLARERCEFNLSHAGDRAAVALASQPVGVDIEQLREIGDLDALAERCFTPAERRQLGNSSDLRVERFLCGWTRKEACLKAIGCGLLLEPASFVAGLMEDTAEIELSWEGADHRLRVQSFRDDDTLGAVAVVLAPQTRD